MALVLGVNDQFMHNHALKKHAQNQNFSFCNGCKTPGLGSGYRCEPCDYDLHEYCATCPATLSSFMHPHHELTLFFPDSHNHTRHHKRVCSICNEHTEGVFFGCDRCEFFLHPLCSQMPQYLSHALHPEHTLRLENIPEPSPETSSCLFCNEMCTSWHYKCPACRVGVHFSCLVEISGVEPSAWTSRSLQGGGGCCSPHNFPTSRPPAPATEAYTLPPPQSLDHLFPYGSCANKSPTIPPAAGVYQPPPPHSFGVYGYNSPTIPPATGVYYPPPPQPFPQPQHHSYSVYGYNSPTIHPAAGVYYPPPPHSYNVYGYNSPAIPAAQPLPLYGGGYYYPQQPMNCNNYYGPVGPHNVNHTINPSGGHYDTCHANHESNINAPPGGGGGGGQPVKPQESGGGGGGSGIGKIIRRILGTMVLSVTSSAIYDQLENIF